MRKFQLTGLSSTGRPSQVTLTLNVKVFQLNVERNPGLHWFCFTLLCDWSRKLAPLYQPITTWLLAFSCVPEGFLFWVLIGSFRYFPQFWLAGDDTMVLVLRYSIMWSHSQPSFCSTSIIPQSRNSVMARYKKNHLPKLNSRLRNCSLSESGWGIERLLLDLALCNLERENF